MLKILLRFAVFNILLFNSIVINLIPADYYPYTSIVYLVLLLISILFHGGIFSMENKGSGLFLSIVTIHVILIFYYGGRGDYDSAINLLSLLLASAAAFYFSIALKKYIPPEVVAINLLSYCFPLLVMSIFASAVMTYFGLAGSPPYYPWEAFYSDYRFITLTYFSESGGAVGHSNSMLLAAFSLLYLYLKKPKSRITFWMVFLCISLVLFSTKSRAAILLYFLPLSIKILCFDLHLISPRKMVVILLSLPLIYFYASSNQSLVLGLGETVAEVQKQIPGVRLIGSDSNDVSLFTGRDILNQVYFRELMDSIYFGVGHSAPIIKFGVNKYGQPAAAGGDDRVASSESGLRVLVKYGILYFIVLLIILMYPIICMWNSLNVRKNWPKHVDAINNKNSSLAKCVLLVYSCIAISLFDGIFENPREMNFFYLLLIFLMWQFDFVKYKNMK